jgi:hypothetical protein
MLRNWWSLIIIFIPIYVLSLMNIDVSFTQNEYNRFKDIVELLSWLFSGVMALIGFSTLFLAFSYENKLVIASRDFRRILKPFSLTSEDLRNTVLDYYHSLTDDGVIKTLYRTFVLISFFIILVWGSAIGFYTKFRFSFNLDFSIGSFLVFGTYTFFFIMFTSLLLIIIAIKLIRLNKDPLGKGVLPKITDICNTDYLIENDADITEFFYVNAPYLELYENPINGKRKYDLIFNLPILVSNFRFVIVVFDKNHNVKFSCYGKTKENIMNEEIADSLSIAITNDFPEELYQELTKGGCYGILKVYDQNRNLVSKFLLKIEVIMDSNLKVSIYKKLQRDKEFKDIHGELLNLIDGINGNVVKYQRES